jgi:flagellar basal-body rod protein FlgF
MKSDIYTALSGAMSAMRQLDVVSNNVANVGTTGFREGRVSFESIAQHARVATVRPSTTDGPLMVDADSSHLALRGDAFFSLADGSFTRDGAFRLDGDGALVTADGTPVLLESGTLQLEPGESFAVSAEGDVTGAVSGQVGRLKLASLATASPLGDNRWAGTAAAAATGVRVVQGALEGSNADPMRSMIELIEASRYFESQQKAMQTSDEMRSRLNQIGGV